MNFDPAATIIFGFELEHGIKINNAIVDVFWLEEGTKSMSNSGYAYGIALSAHDVQQFFTNQEYANGIKDTMNTFLEWAKMNTNGLDIIPSVNDCEIMVIITGDGCYMPEIKRTVDALLGAEVNGVCLYNIDM